MNSMKRILSFVLATILLLTLTFSFAFAAESTTAATTKKDTETTTVQSSKIKTPDEIVSSFNNVNGRVLCVADSGNPRSFPENSLEGINSCIEMGVDIIDVSVARTKDGQFVLMADSDLSRMCVTTEGNEATARISEETLEELQNYYYLKEGHGGENAQSTKYRIASLSDAITACNGKVMLMLDNAWKYADEINALAKSLDACDSIIIKDASDPDEIAAFISKTGLPICHICAEYNPDSSGSVKKYVSSALKSGAELVLLSSEKSYASIFNNSVIKKFKDSGRPFIDMTDTSLCGGYEDRMYGWEKVIDCGYSIIETDYPQELVNYITEIEAYRTELSSLITQAQSVNTSTYTNDTAEALTKSLKEAENIASVGCVSLNQIDSARYNLQEAIDNLEIRTGDEKTSLSSGAIVAIVAVCIVAVLVLAVLILRHINKKKKNQNGKSKAENLTSKYAAPPEDDDSDFE